MVSYYRSVCASTGCSSPPTLSFIPTGFGRAESARLGGGSGLTTTLTHTIVYTYDNLHRLTNANYTTHSTGSGQAGETYAYSYDQVGNRLQQIINTLPGTGGNTTTYLYDTANRLTSVNGPSYSFDANPTPLRSGEFAAIYAPPAQ